METVLYRSISLHIDVLIYAKLWTGNNGPFVKIEDMESLFEAPRVKTPS
jgi:hypothetical protein